MSDNVSKISAKDEALSGWNRQPSDIEVDSLDLHCWPPGALDKSNPSI